MKKGTVYIMGAGPGDYRLLTLKALDCIKNADAIVFDRLIDSKILSFAREDAELVNVGKMPEHHAVPQFEINEILLNLASAGKLVARVKGGDPFLFGRGGEECEYLQNNGIDYEVIPGVTSAIAVPAYSGIPVTHREYSSSLHIFTGHNSEENADSGIDFETIAKLEGTLVFLMGVKSLEKICNGLINNGKPKETPAAIVEKGTSSRQRLIKGTLGDIVRKAAEERVTSPAVIVIGKVADLSEKLAWFGKKPLHSKKIVVTRSADQSLGLISKIEDLGGEAVAFPVIRIEELEEYSHLERVLERIQEYKWLVFTSVNGVNIFFKYINLLGFDIRSLVGIKLAVVGKSTAEALWEKGLRADYVPDTFTASDLSKGLVKLVGKDEKVLIVKPEVSSNELSEGFRKNSIDFDEISIYKTVENNPDKSQMARELENRSIDYVIFSSPSAVKAFVSIVGKSLINESQAEILCAGPVTAKAAEELGLKGFEIAEEHCDDGVIKKLIEQNGGV